MWSRENVFKLIGLMETHRCLWDATDENRKKRENFQKRMHPLRLKWGVLSWKLKKKINNLRSQMNGK